MREQILMDPQWKFLRGDFPVPNDACWLKGGGIEFGPVAPAYDDSKWRPIDLPHDFIVEGEVTRELPPGAAAAYYAPGSFQNMHMMHGYRKGGVGWYRKTFEIPAEDEGRVLALEFDGVFRDSTVWLNKNFVGTHLSGYTGFRYDVSALLNYGGSNTVVVRVDAREYEGWFYEGGGIYRHVWLLKQEPVHIAPHGVFVACAVDLAASPPRATAEVHTEIANAGEGTQPVRLVTEVRDPQGRIVAEQAADLALAPGAAHEIVQALPVPEPELWSLETPRLYTAVSRVLCAGVPADEVSTSFGIRKIHFDPDRGFFLNDQPVKLKGVCCHQDHAGVGSALPDRLQGFRLERLKEMGCNAYRTAHHPPTPELLDACDRLGLLVMDENRVLGTAPEFMHQLRDLVKRDRNHPSVILWSIGNEETLLQGTAMGARIAAAMIRQVRRLDETRRVTLAMNGSWGEGASRVIDVQGCNYIKCGDIDAFHRKFPDQPVVYSEAASALGTRGIYQDDPQRGYVSAYDVHAPAWGNCHEENWRHCVARPFVAGTFIWTGFDYRGEPTPYYDWPCISSHFGILDTCGYPKDAFYYYQAWWTGRDVLHLFPHWNWPGREGQAIEVWVYSNFEEVELQLNGATLGRHAMPRDGHLAWPVPYAPGALTAVGYRGGREIERVTIETSGPAAGLRLIPDRASIGADGEDLAVVRVEALDARQRRVATANPLVRFQVEGPGEIIGVGNGDPSCHEADKGAVRSCFNGLCQVIVRGKRQAGAIRLRALADGLPEAELTLQAETAVPRPWLPAFQPAGPIQFERSALQPGGGDLLETAYPGATLEFQPLPMAAPENFCEVRKYFEGQEGIIYVRLTFAIRAQQPGSLVFGADGPVKAWVNGRAAAFDPSGLPPAKPEANRVGVAWRAGRNEILFAIAGNGGKTWGLFARPLFGG